MCGLCGVLGGKGHWSDTSENPAVFAGRAEQTTWRRERQERVRLINRILLHYGLSLSDWEGASYLLRGRTGATLLVANLGELWPAVETLAKRPCDPLDEALLEGLSAAARPGLAGSDPPESS